MQKLNKEEMLNVIGGSNWITSAFLNALSKAANTLLGLGRSLGTAIRRTISGKVCSV